MIYLVIARKGTEQVRFERPSVEAAFKTVAALRALGWLVKVSAPLKGTARLSTAPPNGVTTRTGPWTERST